MYIIALKGKSDSGKTSSIKYLIMAMLQIPDVQVIYTSKFGAYLSDKEKLVEMIKNPWDGKIAGLDITMLLEYRGKQIYITSNGDCIKDILRNLDNVTRKYGDIDIYVCGRHKCNDVEKEFSAYPIDSLTTVEKERAINGDFDEENRKTGKELFSEIENILQTR